MKLNLSLISVIHDERGFKDNGPTFEKELGTALLKS